eukprot:scaffold80423_cov14-Tisochrysis_lutea.AAC.2
MPANRGFMLQRRAERLQSKRLRATAMPGCYRGTLDASTGLALCLSSASACTKLHPALTACMFSCFVAIAPGHVVSLHPPCVLLAQPAWAPDPIPLEN